MDNKDKRDMLPEDEYLKRMSSLPKVKAPDDFLQKVHERLEKRTFAGRLADFLFVPFRIKIPLEVAAVTATLLFVISALEVTSPVKVFRQEPSVPRSDISDVELAVVGKAEKGKEVKREYVKVYDEICADKKAMEYSGGKDQAVMKNEMSAAQEKKFAPAVELEETPAVPRASKAADADMRIECLKMKSVEKADTVSLVKSHLTSAHGAITHTETDKNTGKIKYIDAEIPVADYTAFVKSLENLIAAGSIKMQPILKEAPQGRDIIQVRIIITGTF